MKLNFVKMHGLGNDFILLDGVSQKLDLTTDNIRHLSHRKFGIGCDQLLIAQSPSQEDVDFRYRIFNSDGSEVEQCGNGARCFAQFVRRHGLTDKEVIKVDERVNIVMMIARGEFLKIFPLRDGTLNWGTPGQALPNALNEQDSFCNKKPSRPIALSLSNDLL